MEITGPAAGHDRLKTTADPTGTKVLGMLNNCAGGITPWGTWLTCEENFNGYFWGKLADDHPEAAQLQALRRARQLATPGASIYDRFDVDKEPNEPNRFGWMVEIDPFDPTSTPKKRTALGRFKHEGAAGIVNTRRPRRRLHRATTSASTTSTGSSPPAVSTRNNRAANCDLLDEGTLYVAQVTTPTAPANGCRWCTARAR